ncbi:uncharacterized protein LOC133903256 [Phragmites australis]|uniref:uncharacterized protein LOC133903256 n=1 Tax=Phragmites australis TaxID=29695 RepID=UPI002D781CD1|nr:uncharacterized protein LOC133903256 [Phragmites australis]
MAKEVWDCLKTRFVGADRLKNSQLQTLKSEFDAMRMQEGETLDQYVGKLNGMSVSVITGIEQFYDLDTMSFKEVKAWQKKDSNDSSSSSKGKFHAPAKNNNHGRGGRGRGGVPCTDEESSLGDGRRNKSHIKCYDCYKMGHYTNEYNALKKEGEETHLTCADDTELALLLVVSEEVPRLQQRQDVMLLNKEKLKPELCDTMEGGSSSKVLYLDNGASNHMIGDKEKFRELDEGVTGKVKFVDGSTVQIMGLGFVVFSCKNGDQWLLQEVYYIP